MKKKNDESIELSEKDFSFVCPMKTEDMTVVDGGYFCGECEKKVYDVSHMAKDEYQNLVEKIDDICISFKKVSTVSLALSLAACASPEKPKPILLGKIVSPKANCNIEHNKSKTVEKSDKNTTVHIRYDKIRHIKGKRVIVPKKKTLDDK